MSSGLAYELATDNTIIIFDGLAIGRMVDNIADLTNKENVRFIQGTILDCVCLLRVLMIL